MKKLERSLTLPYVVAIAIGGMLGSGLFVLPGLAAAKTGPSVWLAYLIGAICVLPAALSKSELATAMPTSGGTYVYIERAFGPMMGTISGIGLWLSLLLKSSFALVGFGAYLSVLTTVIPVKYISLLMLAFILIINLFGVKKVGKVQLVIVSLSLIGISLLFIFGLADINPGSYTPFLTSGNSGLLAATGFIYVSYAGVTKVAAIAEEIKNPDRNLPVAMMSALFIVGLIYASVTFVLVGNIPLEQLSTDLHPIYTLADSLGGKTIGIFAAVLGVVTLSSMANSGVLAASRFPFAMSRDQLLPPMLKKVHPKYLTPFFTIIMTCAIMAIVISTLDVEKIAKLASAFKVMMFILVNATVIILRETSVQWYKPTYKSPMYPFIQIFGIIAGIVLLSVLGIFAMSGAIGIIFFGILIYVIYGRNKSQRSGVLKLYGHRPALYLLSRGQKRKPRKIEIKDLPKLSNTNLDGTLADNAEVVVPLFGNERSPEMLVEIGGALTAKQKLQVVHLTEVPEQTSLDAIDDSEVVTSLNRRINAMSIEKSIDVDFDAAVTHDLVETVHSISDETHCNWLVMGWDGRSSAEVLFIRNPLGWLVRHINSNFALFKDNGVRYIRRILICLRPQKNDLTFIQVAIQIASFYNAELTLMRVITDQDQPKDTILKESEQLIQNSGADINLILVESNDAPKTIIAASASYDLLVIGTPNDANFKNVLFGNRDKLAEGAACSVLRLTLK